MKFCSKCGKELMDEAVICTNCGCAVVENIAKNDSNDSVSPGLVVLSILLPIVGIIYWPVKHKETPKRAQACGVAAIVSWAVSFVILYLSQYYFYY